MPKPVEILGVKIDAMTMKATLDKIRELLDKKTKTQIATVNTEFLMDAQDNPDFLNVINNSRIRVADGVGVMIGAKYLSLRPAQMSRPTAYFWLKICLLSAFFNKKFLNNPIPERITGVELTKKICEIAAEKKLKVFLLGADPGIAQIAALKLQTDIYGLNVVGSFSGSPKIENEQEIINLINRHKADILFVAYGAPAQDLWIARNLRKTSCRLAMGVGGTFDFLSGHTRRAPEFYQRHNLEWFYRLVNSPRKRFKRQMKLPRFLRKIYRLG